MLLENCIASMNRLELSKVQATKGLRWMPWCREPMKDVAGCESLGKLPSKRRSEGVRMGKPSWGNAQLLRSEHIGPVEVTG